MIAVSANLPLTPAFRWLKQGWGEFMCSGMRGAAYYGAFFVLMGYVISYIYGSFWQATMGITAGFFLMGPLICCGVYDLSRQRERGEPQSLVKSWFSWTRNRKSIAFFAAMLTFFMII
jgi:uncharacterized membrane protein